MIFLSSPSSIRFKCTTFNLVIMFIKSFLYMIVSYKIVSVVYDGDFVGSCKDHLKGRLI